MENKVKRGLELACGVLSIIIGALELIGGIIMLALGAELGSAGIIILSLVDLGLAGGFIAIGILLCLKPVALSEGGFKSRQGRRIGLIILCSIYFLMAIICFALNAWSVFIIISFILSLASIGMMIGAMSMKDESDETSQTQIKESPVEQSLDGKVQELKRLRELGVLTEEQYAEAVERVIKKETENI